MLTVPLGALADAYLDALASLEADRLGNVSAFVAVAGQLILIKSRAMLPRTAGRRPPRLADDEAPDPEAELRARLILYRAHRDAGLRSRRPRSSGSASSGASRRPRTPRRVAGARPLDAPPLDPDRLVRALDRLAVLAPPLEPPPEVVPRTITLTERADIIRAALRGAPTVVLQDLLDGVRDRVVIAVTFLAMLELMKRREIVVSQADAVGPDRGPRDDGRGTGGGRGRPDAEATPLDESLESFA